MITIIHGDDIVKSREKLTRVRDAFPEYEVFQLAGDKASTTDIVQIFESQSLFDLRKLLILERFIETKDKKIVATILNHLKKQLTHEVIFWEPKEIKKELLALFPKQSVIYFYKQEQVLFQFLDSIKPGNAKQLLTTFHQLLQKENPELVFYMLVRQFRLLLAITTNAKIDEAKRLAPWQRSKLERQAKNFSLESLKAIYGKLFQIEKETKTGVNSLSLPASLDLLLSDI